MRIKDIVNRDIVNLTNCEHEPIHIPGSIQEHGCLLAIIPGNQRIEYCSGNAFDYLGLSYTQLLGKTFTEAFGEAATDELNAYIGNDQLQLTPVGITLNGTPFSCTIQTKADICLLNLEPVTNEVLAVSDVYRQTKQFVDFMQQAKSLQSLCQTVAEETKRITGYDRVMIYRFDKDYNGEVFAESCNDHIEPFLGLHYPHTDIPVQARELYVRNLLRLIVDVNYQPVPIYTLDDGEARQLDLSLSPLRSVSPIHIEYLQNMGVGATLTISLIHQEKLWGLITCHHYSPKYISYHSRISAQLQGHFLTSQINVRQVAEEYDVARKVNESLDKLLEQVFSTESLQLKGLSAQKELLELTNATGVIIQLDGEIYSQGQVPNQEDMHMLTTWLHTFSPPTGFSTNRLHEVYADAVKCPVASGLIFHSLGGGPDNSIIWLRPETLQEVNWAGDPTKAIIKDEKGLSPRKSFEKWKEVKKCESEPWRNPELLAAASFANALQKHVHMLYLSKEELKQRKLSEKLKEANAELENINWIGSHDLKEPLRKIQIFASRLLDKKDDFDTNMVTDSVKRMSESARRMQALITDILSYSKLTHIQEGFTEINMNELVQQLTTELDFEIHEKHATITYSRLPKVHGISFLIKQLMTNLLRNALKFSKPGVAPIITISLEETENLPELLKQRNEPFHMMVVRDNGIGFEPEHNEDVFKVFTRLHNAGTYSGTGVGLALCRKIMQNLNGHIMAEGRPGIGAAFYIYFPKID